MSRRSSFDHLSLLDRMEEIAEEQEAEADAGELGSEDEDEDAGVKSAYEDVEEESLQDDDEDNGDFIQEAYSGDGLDQELVDDDDLPVTDTPRDSSEQDEELMNEPLSPLYEETLQGQMAASTLMEEIYDEETRSIASSGLTSDSGGRWSPSRPRGSFARSSFASSSLLSYEGSEQDPSLKSAPTNTVTDSPMKQEGRRQKRRTTIAVPKENVFLESDNKRSSPRSSRRSIRQSGYQPNLFSSGALRSFSSDLSTSSAGSGSRIMQSLRARTTIFRPSTRSSGSNARSSDGRRVSVSTPGSTGMDIAAAVERLGNSDMNTDWENAAAAAAVVAAASQAPAKRGAVCQFGQDEYALVMLTLLNVTNQHDDKSQFTVDPVNAYGYPVGEGKTDAERRGPYSFVLCMVLKVFFDEDERYYTVQRADTGSEQRADPAWMEPIEDPVAVEAALRAAHRTQISHADSTGKRKEHRGFCTCISDTISWPVHFVRRRLIPCYRSSRAAAKRLVTRILVGEFGWRVQVTTVNFLVLCSFIYLFIESFTIAFLSANLDWAATILELGVWAVLVLELIFECLIRPFNYHVLMRSEKAFAPSTARNINRYHIIWESIALLLFIPQFLCVFFGRCGHRVVFNAVGSALRAVVGLTASESALGRFVLGLTFLRAYGLVRHWKQMYINQTFEEKKRADISTMRFLMGKGDKPLQIFQRKKSEEDVDPSVEYDSKDVESATNEEDQQLKKAATIGTALTVVNSQRALFLLLVIFAVFPILYSSWMTNKYPYKQTDLLQANNVASNTTSDCDYLESAITAWLQATTTEQTTWFRHGQQNITYLLWAQVLPVRCNWQAADGVITRCPQKWMDVFEPCRLWNETEPESPDKATPEYFAEMLELRAGGIMELELRRIHDANFSGNMQETAFEVTVIVDENHTVSFTMAALFILIWCLLILLLVGLSVMRGDAGRLVLDPLRRMLKIVVRYAENPLYQNTSKKQQRRQPKDGSDDKSRKASSEKESKAEELGNYETEQLINAISKIADLLRKCWGVAGSGIISSNLKRTKEGQTVVFNPTVPGKRVYALFGFVAINDFSKLLRDLENDVMVLINDVAKVVHEEVYRWAYGDSGQCNKNLGGAFLMVFRIGDFSEVHERQKRATDVVFNSQMKRKVIVRSRRSSKKSGASGKRGGRYISSRQFDLGKDGTLQLASLPGIQSFADRALLGMLKSFAGIHRDKTLQEWKKDFRFGGGVAKEAATVIYGMDAGWAVEGAVGSEYKIDATYLSPHVNMASRMMSAGRQYGVTILLSQAVEQLLSKPARKKLRHLDTVYVKGSSVAQRIFTYDARHEGVDFFLFDRSPEQADMEAEAYSPTIWDTDQDLKAMRQHVTDEFVEKFKKGVEQYLEGNWAAAVKTLQRADDIMIQTVLEEGYIDFDTEDLEQQLFDHQTENEEITRIQNECGDGACKCLIQYMRRRNCVPPEDWHGVRYLMSK